MNGNVFIKINVTVTADKSKLQFRPDACLINCPKQIKVPRVSLDIEDTAMFVLIGFIAYGEDHVDYYSEQF